MGGVVDVGKMGGTKLDVIQTLSRSPQVVSNHTNTHTHTHTRTTHRKNQSKTKVNTWKRAFRSKAFFVTASSLVLWSWRSDVVFSSLGSTADNFTTCSWRMACLELDSSCARRKSGDSGFKKSICLCAYYMHGITAFFFLSLPYGCTWYFLVRSSRWHDVLRR